MLDERIVVINPNARTIISAIEPKRVRGDCAVRLKVWFEELSEPVDFIADPFDTEIHGRELWIRAMAGEYGPIEFVDAIYTASPLMLSGQSPWFQLPGDIPRLFRDRPQLFALPPQAQPPMKVVGESPRKLLVDGSKVQDDQPS